MRTFFQDSAPLAVSALLDVSEGNLTEDDIAELAELIRKAEEKGE
jgi:hypothetical protein